MGATISKFCSLDKDNSNNIKTQNNIYEDWSLNPETTLTDSSLNILKDKVYDFNDKIKDEIKSYDTFITNTTEDIFLSINNGLKDLLDLSADSIDYAMDKLGLYSPSTISSDTINNLSDTTKQKLLNETTSLPQSISSNDMPNSQSSNLIQNSTQQKLLNETSNPFSSTSNNDISNIPFSQTQINKYINSTTSPINQTPINQTPINQTPINQIPNNQTSNNQTSNNQTPINQSPNEIPIKVNQNIQNTDTINTTELNVKLQQIIDGNNEQILKTKQSPKINQEINQKTTQTLNNSLTSSINTSQLSTLNLNDNNISSINLNRF